MAHQRGHEGKRGGFTLIELLVSITIIGVLLSIMAPALRSVRNAGRNAVCLSNLHQIAIAWNSYLVDFRVFPIGKDIDDEGNVSYDTMRDDWGGVDWKNDFHSAVIDTDRPLNPYLGTETENIQNDSGVFRCPSDNGLTYTGPDADLTLWRTRENWFARGSHAPPEYHGTVYGKTGTSYRANEWIWIKPGNLHGWQMSDPDIKNIQIRNRPSEIFDPSRFILVMDYAGWWVTRVSIESRNLYWGALYEWWHANETCNMAFLDGSARQVSTHPGEGASYEWSFWKDERLHRPKSFIMGRNGQGTPRDKLP